MYKNMLFENNIFVNIFSLTFPKCYDIINKSPIEEGEWTEINPQN